MGPVVSCALPHPQACPQSNGVTLDLYVSERDLESLALSGPEGSIQGAMTSAESILAERMSYLLALLPWFLRCFLRWAGSLFCTCVGSRGC